MLRFQYTYHPSPFWGRWIILFKAYTPCLYEDLWNDCAAFIENKPAFSLKGVIRGFAEPRSVRPNPTWATSNSKKYRRDVNKQQKYLLLSQPPFHMTELEWRSHKCTCLISPFYGLSLWRHLSLWDKCKKCLPSCIRIYCPVSSKWEPFTIWRFQLRYSNCAQFWMLFWPHSEQYGRLLFVHCLNFNS